MSELPCPGDATASVEKLMSLSRTEFVNSVRAFGGEEAAEQAGSSERVEMACGSTGTATITYRALPGARLGGLLELPRACVTLSFAGATPDERADFTRRFDIAFQRGGG